MSLVEKLLKNSTVKLTDSLTKSKVYGKKDMVPTSVPMINVALSGRIDGGLTPGLTLVAGPSKHFKSAFSLLIAGAYLQHHKDSVLLFYDSEFGTPQSYFDSFNIDIDRVVHTPITNIEELKFDLMKQLDNIDRGDKICIVIDSVGNLASKKEVEDALNEKSVADMTRAKQLKSLFRMVTPHLSLKDIPLIAINHIYMEQGLYPKAIVSGGCVVEGTMIQTPNGLKAIEDFNVGEKVITLDGEKIVSHVWNPDTLEKGYAECYEIEFEDGFTVICSENHKFLVEESWVEAKDLIVGSNCKTL